MRAHAVLFILASMAASAQQQTPSAQPQAPQQLQQQRPQTSPVAFEVATIKMAQPFDPAKVINGQLRIGAKVDGARAEYNFMSLNDLICNAYKIKPYQLEGPDWMKSQRWDIQATLPDGVPADQAPLMLRELLKDRFKLELHHDSKDHNVYVLIQGKNGHKMKEAEPDPPPTPAAAEGGAPPAGGDKETASKDAKGGAGGSVTVNGDKITMKQTSNGAVVRGGKMGETKVSMNNGQMHMEFSKAQMPDFAEMLTPMVDRPVIDETGLKGKYQVQIDLSMADMMSMARQSGMMGAMGGGGPPVGATAGAGGARPAESASEPGASSVFAGVEQLGLKLTPRKAPMDTIVVDHLEKAPTEN